jgi:polysaccharide export outer membrane protein
VLLTLPAAGQDGRAGGYRLGPRDQISIQVFEEPDLSGELTVNEDGTIRLPLVGNVQAEGLTADELAARLKTILEDQLLQRASVSVEVLEFRSRPISVLGAVRAPGSLNFSGRLTLLEAITAAGGLSDNHGASVHILRRASNGLTDQVSIHVDDLLVRADPDVNLPIFANDLINVPAAAEITVYLLGEVASPGAISFKSTERVTLLAALARAGGLTERASSKIRIQRPGPSGKSEEIVVRYKRVLAGEDPDPELRAGDVIIVKESFF